MFFTKNEWREFIFWTGIILALVLLGLLGKSNGSELDEFMAKENIRLPPDAQKILDDNEWEAIIGCHYPNQAGQPKTIFVVDYGSKQQAEALISECKAPVIKATAVFDLQKKKLFFKWEDEWGKRHFISKSFL